MQSAPGTRRSDGGSCSAPERSATARPGPGSTAPPAEAAAKAAPTGATWAGTRPRSPGPGACRRCPAALISMCSRRQDWRKVTTIPPASAALSSTDTSRRSSSGRPSLAQFACSHKFLPIVAIIFYNCRTKKSRKRRAFALRRVRADEGIGPYKAPTAM